MPSFGEKLKQEREKRKITLEQISVSTKIGTRMLQALEEDKFNQLPGGIFNKGFVRAYSRFVGLDEDQTVAEYLQASGDAPPPATEIVAPEEEQREPAENIRRMEAASSSRSLPWGWFAALLLVVALALSLSHRLREYGKEPIRSSPTTIATPAARDASSTSSSAPNPAASSVTGEGRGDASLDSSSSTPAPPTRESSGKISPTVPPTLGAASPPASRDQPAAPGEFTVVVQAREESWVSVTTDGKAQSSELLTAGSERVIRGRKEIVVKLGNSGGVDVRFNGKKLDTGGQFGEVKTITFGPGGVVPTAPAPVSTP